MAKKKTGGRSQTEGCPSSSAVEKTLSAELLYGAKEIATFLGLRRAQVYHLADSLQMPMFKIGQMVCARPERLREWLEAAERREA